MNEKKSYTKAVNMRAPSKLDIVNGVIEAWNTLPKDLVIKSFKFCGLTVNTDGSEWNEVACIKYGRVQKVVEYVKLLDENSGQYPSE